MLIFSLFRIVKISAPRLTEVDGEWHLDQKTKMRILHRPLKPSGSEDVMPTGVYLKTEIPDHPKPYHLFFWTESELLMIESGGSFNLAHAILDALSELIGLETRPIQPTSHQWVQFIREGELLRAMVATRHGLEDAYRREDFTWVYLESVPLISASISFNLEGPFLVQVGAGTVTIHGPIKVRRVGLIAKLIAKHLLSGENLVESEPQF